MAKKKSRLKRALKKIGKAAAIAGAGYLAVKGLKGRKGTDADANDGFRSKFSKPSIGMVTDGSNQDMPKNLSKDMGKDNKRVTRKIPQIAYGQQMYKSGGSVKKSMGKALRGGGKVMR